MQIAVLTATPNVSPLITGAVTAMRGTPAESEPRHLAARAPAAGARELLSISVSLKIVSASYFQMDPSAISNFRHTGLTWLKHSLPSAQRGRIRYGPWFSAAIQRSTPSVSMRSPGLRYRSWDGWYVPHYGNVTLWCRTNSLAVFMQMIIGSRPSQPLQRQRKQSAAASLTPAKGLG